MSRQREYQKRMRALGRCTQCGAKAPPSTRANNVNGFSNYCDDCRTRIRIRAREYTRKRTGAKRRNLNALSYRLDRETTNATDSGTKT